METHLPQEKLQRLQLLVAEWLGKKKATTHNILSQLGQLQHVTKVVRQGRNLCSRLYSAAAKVKKLIFTQD